MIVEYGINIILALVQFGVETTSFIAILGAVGLVELTVSCVNFATKSWVKSDDYWGVYFDTLEQVKLEFDNKGISIPYPQMDVHQK